MAETYIDYGGVFGLWQQHRAKMSAERRLILVGRKAETLEKVRSKCQFPERHLIWVRDLSSLEGLGEELIALLAAKNATVDHFVHSAGLLTIQYARAIEMPSVMQLFNVNVFRRWNSCPAGAEESQPRCASQHHVYLQRGDAFGGGGYSAYAASKGAVNGILLSLAVELAPQCA